MVPPGRNPRSRRHAGWPDLAPGAPRAQASGAGWPDPRPQRVPRAAERAAGGTGAERSAQRAQPECRMNVDKLKKMAGAVRTGGKGSMRRKKKAVHKTTTTDDKRLQSTLKRVGVNAIPGIEEVNIYKDDVIIQFLNPKVQTSIGANTWVVSGTPQTKSMFSMPFTFLLMQLSINIS
ncbi:hypothetical protein ABZP36_029443 [Zizania latifolia]